MKSISIQIGNNTSQLPAITLLNNLPNDCTITLKDNELKVKSIGIQDAITMEMPSKETTNWSLIITSQRGAAE